MSWPRSQLWLIIPLHSFLRGTLVNGQDITVDDTDTSIPYSSGWSPGSPSLSGLAGFFNGTLTTTSLASSTATFVFRGTQVSIFGALTSLLSNGTGPSPATYGIDGKTEQQAEVTDGVLQNGTLISVLQYASPYLSEDSHTLVITSPNFTSFLLDKIVVSTSSSHAVPLGYKTNTSTTVSPPLGSPNLSTTITTYAPSSFTTGANTIGNGSGTTPKGTQSPSVPAGIIVVISLGTVSLVSCLVIVIWFLCRRRCFSPHFSPHSNQDYYHYERKQMQLPSTRRLGSGHRHNPRRVSGPSMFSMANTPIIGTFSTGDHPLDDQRSKYLITTSGVSKLVGNKSWSSPWTISARSGLPSIDESMGAPMSSKDPREAIYGGNKIPHWSEKYRGNFRSPSLDTRGSRDTSESFLMMDPYAHSQLSPRVEKPTNSKVDGPERNTITSLNKPWFMENPIAPTDVQHLPQTRSSMGNETPRSVFTSLDSDGPLSRKPSHYRSKGLFRNPTSRFSAWTETSMDTTQTGKESLYTAWSSGGNDTPLPLVHHPDAQSHLSRRTSDACSNGSARKYRGAVIQKPRYKSKVYDLNMEALAEEAPPTSEMACGSMYYNELHLQEVRASLGVSKASNGLGLY